MWTAIPIMVVTVWSFTVSNSGYIHHPDYTTPRGHESVEAICRREARWDVPRVATPGTPYSRWADPDLSALPRVDSGSLLSVLRGGHRVEIGRGASAVVYLCKLLPSDRLCVVKVAHEHLSQAGWSHESRLMWLLSGSGVTPVFHGLLVHRSQRLRAFVMDYLSDGVTLAAFLAEHQRLSPVDGLGLALAMARALQSLHSRQVVHGDLTEDNIYLQTTNDRQDMDSHDIRHISVYFLDLGQAARFNESYGYELDDRFREFVHIHHKYVAPELVTGAHFSARSDIYALGHIYERLSELSAPELVEISALCKESAPQLRPNIDQVIIKLLKICTTT